MLRYQQQFTFFDTTRVGTSVHYVNKMRGSAHSKDVRLYDVTEGGLVVGNTLYDYRGVITGVAQCHQASESGN